MKRPKILFPLLILLLIVVFLFDLKSGAYAISWEKIASILLGNGAERTNDYIIMQFRLPKTLTALVAGAGIAVSGLQMQSLFRNPLADTSILGINSGAGVGVALYTMSFTLFPSLYDSLGAMSNWGIILSACIGSLTVLFVIAFMARRLGDMVSVLIVGVMLGFLASSLIALLQYFSEEESLKSYLIWSFGSLSNTTWGQLQWLIPLVLLGLVASLLLPKQMNALNLGDNYARSLGVNVKAVRFSIIAITSLITGTITAFVGPIAFLGMAVPHFVRILFGTADNRILIPATILSGSILLLICDILTQLPASGIILPINALTSLLGAPVVIAVVFKSRQNSQKVFS